MRLLHVDAAAAGAAGDMILGALVDLGLPVARLKRTLESLPIGVGWSLRSRKVIRHGLAGRKIDVRVRDGEPGRRFADLKRIVEAGALDPEVRRRALEVFRRLIEAEAEVHAQPVNRVHLHEAGAADALVDVVGACFGVHELGVEHLVVSPMTTGFGTVSCAHGDYPVPAPATLLLVRDCPVRAGGVEAERLTPTGAAILTTLADAWGPLPPMRPQKIGYGAGNHEFDRDPNFLRMVLGSAEPEVAALPGTSGDPIVVIETTVDDVSPQTLAYACERLLSSGALDVYTTALTMKKGRSGHKLTVLARPDDSRSLSRCLIEETSTLGLRLRVEQRIEVTRAVCRVRTRWGAVRVKSGRLDDGEVRAWPEYEDCAAIARGAGVALRAVQRAALDAYRRRGDARRGRQRRKT